MDYVKDTLSVFDETGARHYRDVDQRMLQSASHRHYCKILRELTAGFERRISVLDAGCGSGRFFHCLRNVRHLLGIDVSPHMLDQARNPVSGACRLELPPQSFGLIYSIGVLGEYSPLNAATLSSLFRLLEPGGKLFVTAVDTCSRLQMPESTQPTFIRRALRKGFHFLPSAARRALNRSFGSYYVSEAEVKALLHASQFTDFTLTRYHHTSGWPGIHFDCLAHRPQTQDTVVLSSRAEGAECSSSAR
jgi:SAM-dependent methyltransferase